MADGVSEDTGDMRYSFKERLDRLEEAVFKN
jgi:hypothetical protein